MTAFSFYLKPGMRDPAAGTVTIADTFAYGAALFGPLWFLNAEAVVLAVLDAGSCALIYLVAREFGLTIIEVLVIGFFYRLGVGFEARNLLRLGLEWRGYRLSAIILARSIEEAELRYFSAREKPQPDAGTPASFDVSALASRLGPRAS